MKKWSMIKLVTAGFVALWFIILMNNKYKEAVRLYGPKGSSTVSAPTSLKTDSSAQQDTFEANTSEWKGVTCLDSTKNLQIGVLEDNIYWYLRLDRDDRRIYPMPPRNKNLGKQTTFSNFNTMEIKIAKDQGRESVRAGWLISNRR